MAQALSSAGIGHNGGVSQAVFLEYLARHEDADAAIDDAKETVRSLNRVKKNLRKTITADGINIDQFDRALADGRKSGEEREAEDRQYRRYMAFQNKPLGFQDGIDFTSADPNLAALNALELQRIEDQGYDAGKHEHARSSNTYTPGTPAYQVWDEAWRRGDADREAAPGADQPQQGRRGGGRFSRRERSEIQGDGEAPAAGETAAKRGRGRPRKNGADAGAAGETTPRRGRGRPRKNPPEDAGAEA